ncbi:MAG: hypothetical protein AAF637_04455 [Pseudomonadota bacterium]
MHPTRRHFLGSTGAAASFLTLGAPGLVHGATDAASDWAAYFEGLGYQPVPAHPLITMESYNGGLRFDEMPHHRNAPAKRAYLQPCSRLMDVDGADRPATLALFHILALLNADAEPNGTLLREFLAFLTDQVGLDPARLVMVSTPRFEPYRGDLEAAGLASDQLVLRSVEEAVASRDGSGFYRPEGFPYAADLWTASFHYLTGAAAPTQLTYPLPENLELGEIVFATGPDAEVQVQEGGFGLERLLAARGDVILSFEESRLALLGALEAEAERRNIDLPPGYGVFSAL